MSTKCMVSAFTTPTTKGCLASCRGNFYDRIEQVNLALFSGGDHRLTAHKEHLFELMCDFVGPAPEAG